MAYDPAGLERRIKNAEIVRRRPGKYQVMAWGPAGTRVHTERGLDAVKIHSGCEVEVSGYMTSVRVEAVHNRLNFLTEVIPESGAKILHITGE